MRRSLPLLVIAACSSQPLTQPVPAAPDLGSAGPLRLSVSEDTLRVPEGASGGFDLSLAGDLEGSWSLSIVSSDPTSLPVTPGAFVFDAAHRSAHVTVAAPVDDNDRSEVATITLTGDGVATARVAATVEDATQLDQYGAPSPFPSTGVTAPQQVACTKLTIDAAGTLSSLGVVTPLANGDYRLALYDDEGGRPGALLVGTAWTPLVDGVNLAAVAGAVPLTAGDLWVCVCFDAFTDLGTSTDQTAADCYRNQDLSIAADWPSPLGAAACFVDYTFNLFITGHHQR